MNLPRIDGCKTLTQKLPSASEDQVYHEAALVVPVPEAEALVGAFRERYDPATKLGVPAHITINHPFNAFTKEEPEVLDELKALFIKYARFEYRLVETRRFPGGLLYLALEPEKQFTQLIQAIWDRYPDSPPYGGEYDEIIPHLTVADIEDKNLFDSICEEFDTISQTILPVRATAREVWLMARQQGAWGKRARFGLS